MKQVGYVLYGIYVLMTLWLLMSALVQVHLWLLSKKKRKKADHGLPATLPFVSIQLPIYNEKYVVEGLLDSICELDYPKSLFEVLVLDDSTDETSTLIDHKVAALKASGILIKVVRRQNRKGYKAGALQESLPFCKGDLIAVFDADFRPDSSFLKKMIPFFSDEKVGLVQARWGHLNPGQNFLTRIQTFLLDTYFTVEQVGRKKGGYFTNFCGTAGIWRKECILDAGGWDGSVLSEDLDLSYRAQLKGWKLEFDADTEVPAEIPSVLDAFKIQQFRWTKGIMQVFRKNWRQVSNSPVSFKKKVNSFFHLTSSFVFPCLFINSLVSLPLLLFRQFDPVFVTFTEYTAIGGLNLVFLTIIFYHGVKNRNRDVQFSKYYPLFLVVYMAMSVQNTIAVFQGLLGHQSPFIRTPKTAIRTAPSHSYSTPKMNAICCLEMAMLLYFTIGIILSFYLADYFYLSLYLMMSCGLGILVFHSLPKSKHRFRLPMPKISWR